MIIAPKGRLNTFGASKLDEALKKLIKKDDIHVIIEMGDIQYLSSGGIRILLSTYQMLAERGGKLFLSNINEYPLEVLEMAGSDQIFSFSLIKKKFSSLLILK